MTLARDRAPGAAADEARWAGSARCWSRSITSSIRCASSRPGPRRPQAYGHFLVSHIGEPGQAGARRRAGRGGGRLCFRRHGGLRLYGAARARRRQSTTWWSTRSIAGRASGRPLLDAALAELAKRGAPRAVLSTAEKNHGAQRMFDARRLPPDDDRDDARALAAALAAALGSGAIGARKVTRSHSAWMLTSSSAISAAATALALQLAAGEDREPPRRRARHRPRRDDPVPPHVEQAVGAGHLVAPDADRAADAHRKPEQRQAAR